MTSVMWVSVRAAGGMSSTNGGGGARSCPNSPPPLFQSPLVTAEQVSIFMWDFLFCVGVVVLMMVGVSFHQKNIIIHQVTHLHSERKKCVWPPQ